MDNQINTNNQNTHQIENSLFNHSSKISEKLKIKYLITSTLILIGFSVFGVTGYFLEKNSHNQSQLQRQIEPTAIPSATPTSTSWTTYQNAIYQFEFQYPTIFVHQKTNNEEKIYNNNIRLADFKTADGKELTILLDKNNFSVDYLKKYAPTSSENFNPELQTIDNNLIYYYGPGGGGVCYPDQYFINLSDQILIFNFTGCDNDKTPSEKIKTIEKQILSTLKISGKTGPTPTITN
jgi:hypothetical protein